MAESETHYTRLPGRSGRFVGTSVSGRQRLWLGDGLILNLIESGYTERHNRFHLEDIQAIACHRTRRRDIYTGILCALMLLFLGLGGWVSANFGGFSPGAFFFWVICAALGTILLINLALGPTCACRLYTAVQSVHLRSLGREREARRFFDHIKPVIESVQGQVTREDLEGHGDLARFPAAAHAALNPAARRRAQNRPPASGWLHVAFFATMLMVGALSLIGLVEFGMAFQWTGVFVSILSVGLNVGAIIVQGKKRVPLGLSAATITALVYTILTYSIGSLIVGISMGISGEEFDPFSTSMDFGSDPLGRVYLMVSGAIELLLGVVGGLMAAVFVKDRSRAASTPATGARNSEADGS